MFRLILVLVLATFSFLSAEDISYGELLGPKANGDWKNLGRWKDVDVDGKKTCKLVAGTSYASFKVEKLPEGKNVILEVHCYVLKGGYSLGIGAWGSPTMSISPRKKGWYTDLLVFPLSRAKKFYNEGKLSLMFQKNGDVSFRSVKLLAAPKEKVEEIYRDYVTASTQQAFKDLKSGAFTELPSNDNSSDYKVSDDDLKRGGIPFCRSYLKFIFPDTMPKPKEVKSEDVMVMSLNEFEPFQFSLHALKDLKNIKVSVSGVPSDVTSQLFWVESAPKRNKGSRSKKIRIQPNRLWPTKLFPQPDLKKNSCGVWWVILKSNKGTKPGSYKVKLTVSSQSKPVVEFVLNVKILPILLPDKISTAVFLTEANMIDDDDILKGLAEHGQNSMAAFNEFKPIKNKEVDFTAWDQYFVRLKKYGIDNSFFWYLGNPRSGNSILRSYGEEKFIKMIKEINARVKDGRYPPFFALTVDEAVQSGKAFKDLKQLNQLLKKYGPLLKCQGTSLDRYKHTVRYEGFIDILACNGSFEKNKIWCKEKGVKLSTYSFVACTVTANHTRLNYGFLPYHLNCVGVNGWAMKWYNGNPFNDLDRGITDWNIFFPNWTGTPVSTPSWEGYREGVDDLRYMKVLEALVKQGKASDSIIKEIKEKGVGKMKVLGEKVVGDSVFGASMKNAEQLDQVRLKVIAEILKAQK